ncbi:hypothetical protein THAOC_23469, partial [Thalassiosira oceanica]
MPNVAASTGSLNAADEPNAADELDSATGSSSKDGAPLPTPNCCAGKFCGTMRISTRDPDATFNH